MKLLVKFGGANITIQHIMGRTPAKFAKEMHKNNLLFALCLVEQVHQNACVAKARPRAQPGAEQREHKAFGQQQVAHGLAGETNGKQGADLPPPPLQLRAK